jgi:cholesterol transport system auxiliary component
MNGMMKLFLRRSIAVMATLLMAAGLTACGGVSLLGPTGPPPNVYDLSPKSTFDDDLPTVDWQLTVEEPTASRALDTDRITVKPTPFEVGYLSGARWSDRAPRMIQTRLVESFENTHHIVAVGRQTIGLRGDYNLKSELREFQAEFFDGDDGPSVLVRMNFKIIEMPAAEIIASNTFERRESIPDRNMSSIITGFDDALGGVMKHAVQWTLRTVEDYRTEHAEELGLTEVTESLDQLERDQEMRNRAADNANPTDVPDTSNPDEPENVMPTSGQ